MRLLQLRLPAASLLLSAHVAAAVVVCPATQTAVQLGGPDGLTPLQLNELLLTSPDAIVASLAPGTLAPAATILVPTGKCLTVMGAGAAETFIDGGGSVQLFRVLPGASLVVTDVTLQRALASYGAAIVVISLPAAYYVAAAPTATDPLPSPLAAQPVPPQPPLEPPVLPPATNAASVVLRNVIADSNTAVWSGTCWC